MPLIIRWPKAFGGGRVIDENVNLCDLFATLCDLDGLEIPGNLDSRSLAPLLLGEPVNWRNETVSQYRSFVMMKQDHLIYQYYGEEIPEVLFDLEADPGETTNFAQGAAYSPAMRRFRQNWGTAPTPIRTTGTRGINPILPP